METLILITSSVNVAYYLFSDTQVYSGLLIDDNLKQTSASDKREVQKKATPLDYSCLPFMCLSFDL